MRLYFIDGHNLILSTARLSDRLAHQGKRASRDEAEALILRWAEREGDVRAHLYFDGEDHPEGHPGNRDEGPLSVRFTDPPAEADDRIVFDASREAGAGEKVYVVTGDGGIRNRLIGHKIEFVDTTGFLQILTASVPEKGKEERFSEGERAALTEEMIAHAAEEEEKEEGGSAEAEPAPPGPSRPATGGRPARRRVPPALCPAPPVRPAGPDREAKRESYRKRMQKRLERRGGGKRGKTRKKRRGY